MTQDPSVFLVFAAGLLSFLSPCVLPLIPSYLSILGGMGADQYRSRLLKTAAGFVLGFSIVFIALGLLISTTFFLMGNISKYINIAAGLLVIVLGLNVIFDFIAFLNYEKRPLLESKTRNVKGVVTAFLAGMAFGAGWTPCIGPILTGILLMAGQGGQTGKAVFFLVVYSAGLALPFLLAALFFDSFLVKTRWLRSHMILIKRVSGIILIIIGLTILTGRYSAANAVIQKAMFNYINWAETKMLPFRLLANFFAWLQNI